jgi:hypothetical protein
MRIIFTLCVVFSGLTLKAQKELPFPKFGKINTSHLQQKIYPIDSNAKAVVLQDLGSVSVEGNSKSWFSIVTKRHRIVHILNKNGYNLANVEIPLYKTRNSEEVIESFKAVTYNLENGKIIETKMGKDGLLTEKQTSNRIIKKFTMPNVKEGCIIEYEYKVNSDFFRDIDDWIFQESVPVIWSEIDFSVPNFFTYAPQLRGYLPLSFTDRKENNAFFSVVENSSYGPATVHNLSATVNDVRWVMENVPSLEEEAFTTSIKNHLSRMEFTLLAQNYPLKAVNYSKNWKELTDLLLKSELFAADLKSSNYVSDEVKPLFAGTNNELEKAKKIFYHLRDNFLCTGKKGISLTESLKTIAKNKKGSVADVNLLLTGLLRHAGLSASPVILSTTSNGYVYDNNPTLSSYNYVICLLKINETSYYLDASDPLIGFNYLLPYCYNGSARLIQDEFAELTFSAEELRETSNTMVIISNNEEGKWIGRVTQTPGQFESYQIRNKIKDKGLVEYKKELENEHGAEIKILDPVVDSLKLYDQPVSVSYGIELNNNGEDILYINPLFGEGWKKNSFNSLTRNYPVEMPFTMDETYNLSMEIPAGYEVDELPKQILLKFDEVGSSFFEYRISNSGGRISFRSRVKLIKALFMPDDYQVLREFFARIVSKHSEQIVFKKKK